VPWQVVTPDGVPTLDPARTACDIARETGGPEGLQRGVVAIDAVLHSGTTRAQVEEAMAAMSCWPHVRVVRESLALADAGSESVLETLTRMMLVELGLGPVQTQLGLSRGGRTAYADLRVGRHLFECDGLVKYRPRAEGGLADDPTAALVEEKRREDFLRSFRLGVTRVEWTDCQPANRAASMRRWAREIAASDERYGRDLGDLAPYVVTRRRPAA
jgi:hypothetical protein